MRRIVIVMLATGCQFHPGTLGGQGDARGGDDDAPIGSEMILPASPVLHVPVGQDAAGTGALSLASNITIDTTAFTIAGAAPPSGVVFEAVAQAPSGPQLAVLRVSTLSVAGNVRVTGSRPLVVIASGDITIDGALLGNAAAAAPGPAGGAPAAGARPGVDGTHQPLWLDGGGGGGGNATAGGAGGDASGLVPPTASGGMGGGLGGDPAITILDGGSGGGHGSATACSHAPGGGGGAIQLSSATSVRVTGAVAAGGGGGGGGIGTDDINCINRASGSGGGSGGMIVLQAPTIVVAGSLTANGGGGGAGANVGADGGNGGDAQIATTGGTPGTSPGGYGARGGTGGSDVAATNGNPHTSGDGNGGGGGGAAGRIAVYRTAAGSTMLLGTVSPTPFSGTY